MNLARNTAEMLPPKTARLYAIIIQQTEFSKVVAKALKPDIRSLHNRTIILVK